MMSAAAEIKSQPHGGDDFGIKVKYECLQFSELVEKKTPADHLKPGQVVRGKVIRIENNLVTVDIGFKSEGQINLQEFTRRDPSIIVQIGDAVDVFLETAEDEN